MTATSEAVGAKYSPLIGLRLYSVSPYSNLTGAPISSVNHAHLLHSRFRSVCLVLPGPGPIEDRAYQADLPVLSLPIQNRGLRFGLFRRSLFRDVRMVVGSRWRYYRSLCRELRREPGLVHIHSRASIAPLALAAARRCGVPSVLHFRETATTSRRDRFWVWLLSRQASAVICVSEGIRRGYGKSIRDRAQVIHNFIEKFPSVKSVQNEIPRVILVGQIGRSKGVDLFLEVCRILRDDGISFEAEMIGAWNSDEEQSSSLRYIREHQLETMVKIQGVVEDMVPVYEGMDILLLPTRRDSLPRVVMEAMSYGVPVVATRIDGLPEMVEEGRTGFLVESEKAPEFAARMKQLLEDASLRRQMGEAGRTRARKLFSSEIYASKMLELYWSLLFRGNSSHKKKADS